MCLIDMKDLIRTSFIHVIHVMAVDQAPLSVSFALKLLIFLATANSMNNIGYRWHSTNIPNYDLCHKCKSKTVATDVYFQLAQYSKFCSPCIVDSKLILS